MRAITTDVTMWGKYTATINLCEYSLTTNSTGTARKKAYNDTVIHFQITICCQFK
jgi:hypothetical protein